jgi:hypothetical protein
MDFYLFKNMEDKSNHSNAAVGNWNKLNDKLLAIFPTLQKIDFEFEEGKRQEMLKRIRTKIGKSKAELEEILDSLKQSETN